MKTHCRITSISLFIICLLASNFSSVHAQSPIIDIPNPAAEDYFLQELRDYGAVDLESFSDDPAERIISGETVFDALINDPYIKDYPYIYISNVTIVDGVFLGDETIPQNLYFSGVTFNGEFDCSSAAIKSLSITNSIFNSGISCSGAKIEGALAIAGTKIQGPSYFDDTCVGGAAYFLNSEFNGETSFQSFTTANYTTFEKAIFNNATFFNGIVLNTHAEFIGAQFNDSVQFANAIVDGIANFSDTFFQNPASFYGSTFGDDANFNGAEFSDAVEFTNAKVFGKTDFHNTTFQKSANFYGFTFGDDANFDNAKFSGDAIFENAEFNKDAYFPGVIFRKTSNFNNIDFGRDVSFKNVSFDDLVHFRNTSVTHDFNITLSAFHGDVDFSYASINRYLWVENTSFDKGLNFISSEIGFSHFKDSIFNGPVKFEGSMVFKDFEIESSCYNFVNEPFDLSGAGVNGSVSLAKIDSPSGLNLSGSSFGSLSIETKDIPQAAFINLTDTYIDSALSITNIAVKTFDAEGMSVGQSTILDKLVVSDAINLRNAVIGSLKVKDAHPQWPITPNAFNLRGMTYSDIDIGDQGLTTDTKYVLLGLVDGSAYSFQAYEDLANFFTEKGHSDWASDVKLAQKRRERNEVLAVFSGAWLWAWFLDIFAGYGYRPIFALGWSLLVIAIGSFVFHRKEDMLPIDHGDAEYDYNPIWYSLALFAPYVDLGITSKWEPNPKKHWIRIYKYIHMILGWILAPIALLTFSGLLG